MGKSKRHQTKPQTAGPEAAPFNNPFASLSNQLPARPEAVPDTPPASSSPGTSSTDEAWSLGGKVVLRCERKGHGGKTVTVVSGLSLRGIGVEQLARKLAKQLGCSVRVDGEHIQLAGDQRERAEPWLHSRGVKQVVLG